MPILFIVTGKQVSLMAGINVPVVYKKQENMCTPQQRIERGQKEGQK
jgi:hypothetical protein